MTEYTTTHPVFVLQPDTASTVIQDTLEVDTTAPSINIQDTILRAKPLPFPEERVFVKPEKTYTPPKKTIDPAEIARKEQEQWKQKVDSLMAQELNELKEPFISLKINRKEKIIVKSNFYNAEVTSKIEHKEPLTFKAFSPDWIFGILLVSSFIIILIRSYYDKYLNLVFKSFHNYQFSFKLFKDQSVLYTQLSYILNLNSALVLGLYFFQLVKYSNTTSFLGFKGFGIYLIIPAILVGIYVLQYIVYNFIGDLTLRRSAGKEYLHHSFMLNKIMGLVFIPITLCVAYLPDNLRVYFIYAGGLVIAFFYLKRIQRGFIILNRNHVLKFYWILYFCILEILPVLIMVKLVISFI